VRILHLVPSLSSGGAERQLQYLAEYLVSHWHEVHIGFVHHGIDDAPIPQTGAQLHQISVRSNADPLLLLRLYQLVKLVRPQIIQTWLLQMDVAGGLIAAMTRTAWVLREPNVDLAYAKSWKFYLRRWIASFSDAIVSNSASGMLYWAGRQSTGKLNVITNGIPYERIRAANTVPIRSFGCDAEGPTVLYAGRLVSDHYSEKNLAGLLRAMRIVNDRFACNLLIAGTGPQRAALEALAAELGIGARVIFAGQLTSERLWEAMKAASALALVSPFEGMPNAVMEAVACGCPVVLSDIPPHRELLDSEMALFVDHANPAAIAKGLLECLTKTQDSRARAARAMARAETWSIARMAKSYEELYAGLLAKR
jgi:glycosyltransferase involved in cell wall biosynthesis